MQDDRPRCLDQAQTLFSVRRLPAGPETPTPPDRRIILSDARNLGPRSADMLFEAGFLHLDEVRQLGPDECFRRVRMVHPNASLNLLWALEGALTDQDWRAISSPRKRALKRAVEDILWPVEF